MAEAHLARARLPLGHLEKREVRALAAQAGLRTAQKADSQEICFVPSNDYRRLLAERGVELHPGELVDTAGRVVGRHEGTEHFTIGQRRGHGVGGGTPLYVVDVCPTEGRVVLGTKEECHTERMTVRAVNWIGCELPDSGELRAAVQVRYHHRPAACTIAADDEHEGGVVVEFDEPQLAVAPGQGAAFYDGDRLLGGGWIEAGERRAAVRAP